MGTIVPNINESGVKTWMKNKVNIIDTNTYNIIISSINEVIRAHAFKTDIFSRLKMSNSYFII